MQAISLGSMSMSLSVTSTGVLLITINCSARCIKNLTKIVKVSIKLLQGWHEGFSSPIFFSSKTSNEQREQKSYMIKCLMKSTALHDAEMKYLENLWHKISSISSAFLILIETLTLFTEGSMKHLSFSLRDTVTGFNSSSLLSLIK